MAVGGKAERQSMRWLSAEDLGIVALETDTVVGHTCKVLILGRRIDPDRLRASIAARLVAAPELRLRIGTVEGRACWVIDDDFDLSAHVVHGRVDSPLDQAGLRSEVARLFEQRLDRSRPLWRIDVTELEGDNSALVWRIHHALADGWAAMRFASAVLWDEDPDADRARENRRPPSAPRHSAAHFAALRSAARETPRPLRHSPFDGHIGAQRSVAFTTLELDGLHQAVATAAGATLNDAVLTVVAGGLRRWLEANHGRLGPVRVKVPVSLHGAATGHGAEPGNRDSFFCLDLPLGSADPVERLTAIRAATEVRKQNHDAQQLDALMRDLGWVSPRLRRFAEHVLAHPRSFALNVSNVPGPHRPVSVLDAPVQSLFSLAEIRERHALRIAVVSLADTLNFGLCADPTLLQNVECVADGIHAEAAVLLDATSAHG